MRGCPLPEWEARALPPRSWLALWESCRASARLRGLVLCQRPCPLRQRLSALPPPPKWEAGALLPRSWLSLWESCRAIARLRGLVLCQQACPLRQRLSALPPPPKWEARALPPRSWLPLWESCRATARLRGHKNTPYHRWYGVCGNDSDKTQAAGSAIRSQNTVMRVLPP